MAGLALDPVRGWFVKGAGMVRGWFMRVRGGFMRVRGGFVYPTALLAVRCLMRCMRIAAFYSRPSAGLNG